MCWCCESSLAEFEAWRLCVVRLLPRERFAPEATRRAECKPKVLGRAPSGIDRPLLWQLCNDSRETGNIHLTAYHHLKIPNPHRPTSCWSIAHPASSFGDLSSLGRRHSDFLPRSLARPDRMRSTPASRHADHKPHHSFPLSRTSAWPARRRLGRRCASKRAA